ncbi:MAG TPA: hypothetical protein VG297_01955 [Bryobacteraceae bacterium]|jgi:hypothetical protein|nr:hypothetical protein [Bryobacteraceae bacterium]
MTRREALLCLPALSFFDGAMHLRAQTQPAPRPDTFKVYTDGPRLLLRPQRLRLLRRERERRSLRWDQFETLWTGNARFPELGWTQALRYQLSDDKDAGTRAVAWAIGPADTARPDDVRQMAIIADWCDALITGDDKRQLNAKLQRTIADARPAGTLADARSRVFAAIALTDAQPAAAQKSLESFFDAFWNATFIASLKSAKAGVPNADAYAMLEIMHAVRDNLNFDLRDTFPAWFRQYPLQHLLAHYPAPWPGGENEFRIPADEAIDKSGPDARKAALSRAAELAMVAYDANIASSQLLQGWVTNDRFLLRGAFGIPYELLWANPYQPGLSYYHVPLAIHDEIGGRLFVRSSWEDDADWIGFFGGQLQLFKDGSVTRMDPKLAREPLDIESAIVFFARESKQFEVKAVPLPKESRAAREAETDEGNDATVFIVGLDPKRSYHFEIDGEEMIEQIADPGGIVYLPSVPAGGVRLSPRPG